MRRFAPNRWQLAGLEALLAASAYTLAMLLRFVDEGSVPPTYGARIVPWALLAAAIHASAGAFSGRLRRPGSRLARRPVLPFAIVTLAALIAVLAVNYLVLPLGLRLPLSVAVIGPLLAGAGSAALRIAATRIDVSPNDLLQRPPVMLDVDACAPAVRGRRVLITGAAGSIGSEIACQVLSIQPASLTLLDANETGLYELERDLAGRAAQAGVPLRFLMSDVADRFRIDGVFQQERPEVVFHAAAYKHVPLVEANPEGGFTTNVLGTLAVCEAAAESGAERVVVISTDKAVNPSSFMGLTKRVAELIVASVGQRYAGRTSISAVRFGNVLGSRGSVVPTLQRQIDAGGPVTITHVDAQRFFMTISEAASLVIRSAAFADSGTIFVLDMGEEVRIVDLAERLVRLRGLVPGRDIGFVYTGLRPGEKLREELADDGESLIPTDHPHVRRVRATYVVDADHVLAAVHRVDERRRLGSLEAADYPAALRELIESTLRPLQVSA